MTKSQFLLHLTALYRVGNRSTDTDKPAEEGWTVPAMAGAATCAGIDQIMHKLVECKALTADEMQAFYDNL